MATYASHRLIMEKSKNCQFLLSCWRYLNFVFAEMFIEHTCDVFEMGIREIFPSFQGDF